MNGDRKEYQYQYYQQNKKKKEEYYQKNKEKMKAYDALRKAKEREEREDDDKGEYKMTEEERKSFNYRLSLFFTESMFQCQEYMFDSKDVYDGYSNK